MTLTGQGTPPFFTLFLIQKVKILFGKTLSGATLAYDASDRLLSVTKSGVTTKFLYDGTDMIALKQRSGSATKMTEYDANNLLIRRYVHGAGVDEPLVQYDGSGTVNKRYLIADERGSIVSTLDQAGFLTGIYKYDEYGVPTASAPARFGYTGQMYSHKCKTLMGMTLFQ